MDLFNTGGAVYDFSTPAQLIHTGNWYTDARMTLDGSEYQLTGGINGDFENHSNGGKNDSHSLFFSSAGTMSLTLDRVDGDIFQFYGLWLKHENFSSYDPPYVRIQYYDENNQVIQSETFESNSFSGTIEPVKDLRVSKVTLYFSGLNNLWLDNLHAGDAPAALPSLTTSSNVFIANESATLTAEVTNDGGGTVTERGFVWNTSGGPTTSDSKVSSGSGTGSFSETVSNLQDGVTYFARVYAINEAGTAYGNEVSFTATGNLPDETQDFTGYQLIGDGDDRMISPDGHFILSSSDDPNLRADDFGAYLNAGGNGETGYLEFTINPDSDLGSFELQSLYLGEYDTGETADFENNIVTGYSDDTVVAETTPYNSVGDGVIDNYPIDYSVFTDKRVNRVRITFTALEGTNFYSYNLVNFTIGNSSTQEPETSNDPPTDIFLSDTSANQSESIHAVVGTLSAADPDVGDTHTYAMAGGAGDTHNDLYNINGDQLRANDAGSMAAGDYSVRIQTTDNDGETFTKAFTITIVDDIVPVAENVDVPEAGYYSVDATLGFTVDVSENVIVNTTGGNPYIELNIGETTDYAHYSSGSGTDKIVFRYTVPVGAQDLDGITIGTQISLNGGTIRDEAGNDLEPQLNNIGDTSGIYIDAISPDAPLNLALDPDSETGFSFEDDDIRYTNITTPEITGEAEPESNVILNSSIDGEVGTATADGGGNWSITTSSLSDGEHTLTATAADLAGNSSIASDALVIMIDTSAPVVTGTIPADNAAPYDESINFVITFSEEVYGMINDDFTLVSTGSAQGTILSLSAGSGESITAVVHNISGDGTLRLDYTGSGAEDIAGNLLPVYSEGTPHQVIPKSEQTISFTEIADRTYGEGEFQLGPLTSSEGLTITYTAEAAGLLNINGNKATILNAGSTKVTATQEGNEEVEAADPVEQTVTVNKAILSVSVDENQNKVYGNEDPVFTMTTSGFVNDDDESVISGELEREEGENAGTYTILQGNLNAGGNYSIDFITADFEIIPGQLTITADGGQSKEYGSGDPVFTYKVSGFQGDDGEDILTGKPAREAGEDVGEYTVSIGNLSAGNNYDISFNSTVFEIRPRPLTLSNFIASDKTYDGTTDVNGTGFEDNRMAGDELEFTYSAAYENTSAGKDKTVNYTSIEITGGASSDNYQLQSSEGTATATIQKRAITITTVPVSITYGEGDPLLKWIISDGHLVGDDSLTGELSRTTGVDAGQYSIEQGTLTAGSNYDIIFHSATFEIEKRELTVEADANQKKIYSEVDPELTFTASNFGWGDDNTVLNGTLSRVIGEDTGEYEIVTGDLSAGDNYTISFIPSDFKITPRPLTLNNFTASDKIYDGTTDVNNTGFDDDRIEGDDLKFTYSAAFENKNTGEGKAVNYTNIVISGGVDRNNYSLAASSASANADIKPKTINIINVIAENKVYDGTNEAVLADNGVISGLVDGETLTLAGPENVTFEDEITGNGKNVVAKGYRIEDGISGDPASNYLLDTNEITISADILKKQLSVIVRDDKKIIDDEPYSGGNGVIFDGFVNGENENILQGSLIYGGTSQGALIPGYYTIEVSGLSSMNYDIEYVDGRLIILSIPAAEHLFPIEGSDRVSTGTNIYVEFDQEISALNLNGIQITYRNQSGQEVNVEGVTGSVANNRLTISHLDLHYDTDYTVSVAEGVVENADKVGNDQFEWSFTTMISPPAKVVLTDPADGEGAVSRKPGFSWHASDEAETYRIQVASDPDFTDMVIDQVDIQESAYTTNQQLDYQMLYYWRVRSFNYSGISEWSDASEFMTLAATPVTVFPVYESENISTAPDIQWSSDHENTQYRLQLAGSDDFKEAIADTLIDEDLVRLTGLKDDQIYFWRVKVENEFTESEWSQINAFRTRVDPVNAEDQIVGVGIEFGDSAAENRRELSGLDYRLIGFPGRDAYKLDQFFEGEYGTGWRAFTDNGNDIDYYDEYTPDDNRFRFIPGKGFWVLSTDKLDFELAILNVEINERDGYDIVLQPGWNIISNPHRGAVSWADVLELNDFQADLYEYNERFVLADSLQPVQGYYIYNNPQDPLESINIPYSSMQQRRKANSNQSALNAAMEGEPSRATLQAIINGDTELKVDLIFTNQTNRAAEEEIDWRRHYPSLEMSKVGMMMIDEDIERGGLIRDGVFYSEQGREYRLKMKNEVGKPFTLSAELSGLPGQARLLLVNPVTNQSWMMADGESVEMTVSEPEAIYRMYVGDQHWLEGHQEELLPQDIMLEQNYPNPFNPVTNIRYSIPNQQNVRLEIYDVIGRRVQVLQNGVQQPGWHLVQFDGNNLSSGVYFYRLQTNNSMKVGSMMLVK